jgi:ribonuclease T1
VSSLLRALWLAVLLSCGPVSPGAADTHAVMSEVAVAELPPEARRTLALIKQGGPFRYRRDGSVFGNRERLLPPRPQGHYREYTVPTPGAKDRGARRIVAGFAGFAGGGAEYYYTEDHYDSFRRIRE